MRALSAADLLTVWERGVTHSLAQRALTLLALACAETPPEQVAQFSVGQRDMLLLALREQTFGSQLASIATCPACASAPGVFGQRSGYTFHAFGRSGPNS